MNFSFAGCGFMGIYHVGVASCLREYVPHLVEQKISGASAGAALACILLCKCPLGKCTSWTMKIASQTKKKSLGPIHPTVDLSELLEEGLREVLPPNAHEIATGRLHISLTRVPDKKNVIVNEFKTFDELIQALLCSAYIPYFSGLVVPSFRGNLYIDGAASDNAPQIDDHTVTVSPFAGSSDICPSDDSTFRLMKEIYGFKVSTANLWRLVNILYPPDPNQLSDICKQGFSDTLRYLQTHKLINCPRHLKMKSRVVKVHRSKTNSHAKSHHSNHDKSHHSNHLSVPDGSKAAEDGRDSCCGSRRGSVGSRRGSVGSRRGSFSSRRNSIDGRDAVDGHLKRCTDCHEKRTGEFTLPMPVVEALAESANINKGLVGYVKSTRLYKICSLMWSPFYVPLDLYFHFLVRVARWLPRCLTDTKRFISTLMLCMTWISKQIVERGKINFKHLFEKLVRYELELGEATFETKELGSFSDLDVDVPVQVSAKRLEQLSAQVNHLFEHELRCSGRQSTSPMFEPLFQPPQSPQTPEQESEKSDFEDLELASLTRSQVNIDGPIDSLGGEQLASEYMETVSSNNNSEHAAEYSSNSGDVKVQIDDAASFDSSSNDDGISSCEEADVVPPFRPRRRKETECDCSCGCELCREWEHPNDLTRISVSDGGDGMLTHTVLSYHYCDDNGDIQETKIFAGVVE